MKGNRLRLAIPLQTVTVTEHGTVTADYNVPAGAEVTVTLTGTWKTYKYVPEVNGNLLTITDEGTLPAGTYAVETTVVQADGEHLRSKYCNMVEISDCNDGVTQEYDDFISGSVTLEEQIFYFAKGDKGDAFTYEDFTEEQIADLQRPATEAAAALNEAEQQRVANERARQTAESARESHEDNRILAEETREGNEQTRQMAEGERQSSYTQAEAARDVAFTEKQTQHQTSFETAEVGRTTAFTDNEQQRGTTFATNEQQRQTTFETNEGTKQGSVAGDGSRWGMYKQAESQRDSSYQAAEQQRNTESSAATSAANNAAAAANKAAEDAEDKIEELTAKEATIEDLGELAPAITVADPAIEVIKVILADKTGEQNLQGLPVRLYLWDDENDAWVLSETKTADTYGITVFSVEYGVLYKITFTQVTGCEVIADVEHRAALIWRGVEATYKLPDAGEVLTVVTRSLSGSTYTPLAGVTVSVGYGSVVKSKQTDAQGQAEFTIPTGQQYTVSTTPIDGLYARYNKYSEKHTASQTRRTQTFTYTPYETGFFLIDGQGRQYNIDEWRDAVTAGTVEAADAKLVKISTEALASHGGVFAIDIDMIAYGTGQPANQAWAASNVKFNSIPENGNNTSADYYYDGYTASQLIKQEGAERSIATPAVTAAMAKSVTVGDETLPGFLGSIAQWSTLWQNRAEIDALIEEVRPDHTNSISARTTQKWTSAQNSADYAWYWNSSANGNGYKNSSYAVVPFFAY